MGMDGLSMSNTGAVREQTSAEMTGRAEQIVQSDPTNDSKQIQTTSSNKRVSEKEEEEENQKGKKNPENEEFEDGLVEEEEQKDIEQEFDIEELDNPNKDFYVKLNAKDDIIELYDSSSERLVETISGNELQSLVRRLNMASGIFVNKKV